jgi:hypothetical protein
LRRKADGGGVHRCGFYGGRRRLRARGVARSGGLAPFINVRALGRGSRPTRTSAKVKAWARRWRGSQPPSRGGATLVQRRRRWVAGAGRFRGAREHAARGTDGLGADVGAEALGPVVVAVPRQSCPVGGGAARRGHAHDVARGCEPARFQFRVALFQHDSLQFFQLNRVE